MIRLTPIKDRELYALPVPYRAAVFYTDKIVTYQNDKERETIVLPDGKWNCFFHTLNCTEQEAVSVVDCYRFINGKREEGPYNECPNYENPYSSGPDAFFATALESLHSLLRVCGCEMKQNYLLIEKIK